MRKSEQEVFKEKEKEKPVMAPTDREDKPLRRPAPIQI